MNRRKFLGQIGATVALSAVTPLKSKTVDKSGVAQRPNILWICPDQQRYDTIHCVNNPHIRTPNLDRLCAEGVAFTKAYSQNQLCTPSRASFLTGLYPSAVHQNRNGNATFPANDRVKLITKRLADIGYDCGLAGKLHISAAFKGAEERVDDGYRKFWYSHSPGQGIGKGNQYTDWLKTQGVHPKDIFQKHNKRENSYTVYKPDVDVKYHQTTWCADRAIEFMNEKHKGPWLMSVNIYDPHPPFDGPAKYTKHYDPKKVPYPLWRESDVHVQNRLKDYFFQSKVRKPDEKTLQAKASYWGSIELIDEQVGRMIQALKDSGQYENTIVLFHADHGDMQGDHGLRQKGCRFYEGLVRNPLIISWPGHFKRGLQSHALVELTDIAPTLADITGCQLEWTHGKSLLPILTGKADPDHHRDFVRCEYLDSVNMYAPYEPEKHKPCFATMYRDARYKLSVYHGHDYGELYDLENDPDEFDNLWENPDFQEIKNDLIKKSFDATMVVADPGPKQIGRY